MIGVSSLSLRAVEGPVASASSLRDGGGGGGGGCRLGMADTGAVDESSDNPNASSASADKSWLPENTDRMGSAPGAGGGDALGGGGALVGAEPVRRTEGGGGGRGAIAGLPNGLVVFSADGGGGGAALLLEGDLRALGGGGGLLALSPKPRSGGTAPSPAIVSRKPLASPLCSGLRTDGGGGGGALPDAAGGGAESAFPLSLRTSSSKTLRSLSLSVILRSRTRRTYDGPTNGRRVGPLVYTGSPQWRPATYRSVDVAHSA